MDVNANELIEDLRAMFKVRINKIHRLFSLQSLAIDTINSEY